MLGRFNTPRIPGEIIPSPTWGALGIRGRGLSWRRACLHFMVYHSCCVGMGDFAEEWALVGSATEAFADLI